MIKYKQLSIEEREKIYQYRNKNISIRGIGQQIGRAPSTISRELARNAAAIGYLPDRAQNNYIKNRRDNKVLKLNKCQILKSYVIDKLTLDKWSPEAIAGRLRHHENIGTISHESIYQFIYSLEGNKMKLYQCLMYKRENRQGHFSRMKRSIIAPEHQISSRPEYINNRSSFGHFEGDLTFLKGSNSTNILTLIERNSRKVCLMKNDNKSSNTTICNLIKQIKSLPANAMKSVTFDNGGEFRRFASLGLMGVKVYFCDPHSPWQKGSIERMHASLHKFISKRSDIRIISNHHIKYAEDKLNSMPRKILNFLTPNEVWDIQQNLPVALHS